MATLTLIPNAEGDETSIASRYPASGGHYDKVDDPVGSPDDFTTYVYQATTTYQRDLYNIPNHTTETGTINSVTIYFRIASSYSSAIAYGEPSQKSGATITDGTEQSVTGTTFVTKSQTYTTNPATGNPYSWDEIDALQIGISLKSNSATKTASCTQVYVVVDYTAALDATVEAVTATSDSEGEVPVLSVGSALLPPLISCDSQGYAPVLSIGSTLLPPLALIDAESLIPDILIITLIEAVVAACDAQGYSPTLSVGSTLLPPISTADGEALTPQIQIHITVESALGSADALAYAPTLTIGITLLPPAATITSQGYAPTLSIGICLLPPASTATSEAKIPTISINIIISAAVATADALAIIADIITESIKEWIALTLKSRSRELTLEDSRSRELTLHSRSKELTLPPRNKSFTLKSRSRELTLPARDKE